MTGQSDRNGEGREDRRPAPRWPEDAEAAAEAEDRRWTDRHPEERPSETSKGRGLFHKLREPVIGLTLAGAVAPLISTGGGGEAVHADRQTDRAVALDEGRITGDVEEAVGSRWAEAEGLQVREATLEGVLVKYGIKRKLAEDIYDTALKERIEPDIAFGLVFTESTFRERAVSHVGARGLTQLMPRTAEWLDPQVDRSQLFDPQTNLRLGFRYLRQLIDKYEGDTKLALLAYNRGPGTVDRVLDRGGDPDNGYADKVLAS